MKLKIDEAGHVVVVDGKPVYIHDDGREIPFDAPGTVATISRINGEAKSHRLAKEAAEEALKVFEGMDAAAARKALETVSNLDAKKLVDAGAVEQIKAETAKAYEEKIIALQKQFEPVLAERDALNSKLIDRTITGAFDGSKYISDKLAVPAPMVKATFGNSFKVENDAIVGYDAQGNKLFSRERPGEIASFDEALSLLVESSPFRDSIMKGSGASGSGARGSGGANGSKAVTRAAFDSMAPADRMAHIKAGGTVADQ